MFKKHITDSEFYMWRTVFALVHADNVVSKEEVRYMAEVMEDVPFSESQRIVLQDDIYNPKDAGQMFAKITDLKDQIQFFKYARKLVWIDGEYDETEQNALIKLIRKHMSTVDWEALIGNTGLELEEKITLPEDMQSEQAAQTILHGFKKFFVKKDGV